MPDIHANLAGTTVATAPSPATTGTSLDVAEDTGAKFPAVPFNATVWPAGEQPTAENAEIIRVTVISGDTLTFTRTAELLAGQVSPTPRTIVAGDQIAETITAKAFTDIENVIGGLSAANQFGSMVIIGHSYTLAGGTANQFQAGMISRLAAMLGIHDDNIYHLGQGAQLLAGITNPLSGDAFGGWPTALQFLLPDNAAQVNATLYPVRAYVDLGVSRCLVIVHGVNDYSPTAAADPVAVRDLAATLAAAAGKHAYRTILSRHRASAVYGSTIDSTGAIAWDDTLLFTGTWADVASVTQNTGAAYKKTNTGNDAVIITLPTDFKGGTVAVCLIGQSNAVTHLTADIDSDDTSLTVNSGADFPQTGTVVIKIGDEEMLVTAGLGTGTWTVTRHVNGTSAASHATNDPVSIATNAHKVTWGGTAGATGTTYVSGQGTKGAPISIVKRIALTAAEAGKTITLSFGGIVTGDTSAQLNFDSWWIETSAPAPSVLVNMPYYMTTMDVGYSLAEYAGYTSDWNAMMDEVVDEFTDGFSIVADVYTPWYNRAGTIGTAMNNTDVTTTGVTFTANDNGFQPVVGLPVSFGGNGGEICVISAVSGSAPNWTLSLLRAQLGTAKATHASGDFLAAADWMSNDNLHPNLKGHAVFAQQIYNAFQAMPVEATYQVPATQGNFTQEALKPALGMVDNYYFYPAVLAQSLGAIATGQQWAHPIYIPRPCIVTEIGVSISSASGNAAGAIRFGIYLPEILSGARPGLLLRDFGQTSNNTTGDNVGLGVGASSGTPIYHLLRPGWYWLSAVQYTAAATIRTFNTFGQPIPIMRPDNGSGGSQGATPGVYMTGISGALGHWSTAGTTYATSGTVIGIIHLRLRAVMHS